VKQCNPADFMPEYRVAPRAACPANWAYSAAIWNGQATHDSETPWSPYDTNGLMPYVAVDLGSVFVQSTIAAVCAPFKDRPTAHSWCVNEETCRILKSSELVLPAKEGVKYMTSVTWPQDARHAHWCRVQFDGQSK